MKKIQILLSMLGCVASTIYTMGTQAGGNSHGAGASTLNAKGKAAYSTLSDQVAASTGTGMTVKIGYSAAVWLGGGGGWQAFGAGAGGYLGGAIGGAAGGPFALITGALGAGAGAY